MYSIGGLYRAHRALKFTYSDGGLYRAYRVLRFIVVEGCIGDIGCLGSCIVMEVI